MNVDNDLRHAPRIARPRHDEQLVDDAIEFTFPATDAVSSAQPGSIVNLRYTASERRQRRASTRGFDSASWWLLPACAMGLALLLLMRRDARRNG
jgi:hypothetical protein